MKVLSIELSMTCNIQQNIFTSKSIAELAYGYLKDIPVLASEIEMIFMGDVLLMTINAPIDQLKLITDLKKHNLKIFLYRFSFLQSSYVIYLHDKISNSDIETAYQKYRFNEGKATFENWENLRCLLNKLELNIK